MRADIAAQVESLLQQGGHALPPVHLWNPPLSGDIDIRIAADGHWFHEGTRFERAALVRLFASILKREGDEYFLVTPVEKWRLRVDGTPFVAIDCEQFGQGADSQLVFTTNTGDRVHCNAEHPLRIQIINGQAQPCVTVRGGLEARLASGVYYRLVDGDALAERGGCFGVHSGGSFFVLEPH